MEEVTAPEGRVSPSEREKIQGLLESKTAEGVTLGLSLLESLGATQSDYEAVFSDRVIKAALKTWDTATWGAVSRALLPHEALFRTFQRWAEEANAWYRRNRDESFNGLAHALIPAARPAFLAAWGPAAGAGKQFIDLADIPAGSFTMASPRNDRSDLENQVQVRITKPFRMGRTVVTQRQWRDVMGTDPWTRATIAGREDDEDEEDEEDEEGLYEDACGDDFPAVYVSWDDAMLFCETLTELERETGRLAATQSYRLPTEAEWEYACRAGTTTAYSFGDDPDLLGDYGWYGGNSGGRLHRVAEKNPNPWGLFDMHGNVWEWCADWYGATLAGGDDPVGPSAGSYRVGRGGSWGDYASGCRSACRNRLGPWRRVDYFGFRVVVLR